MSAQIQFKRGTSADLYAVNPILARGEPGLELDTNKIKYGDGVTPWRDLPYGNPSIEVVDGGTLYRPGVDPDPQAFIPPNLSGLALWLDATDPNYTSVVDNRVSVLSDKSLYARQFFQSKNSNRPVTTNQINSLPVLTFDGSNDAMLSSFDLLAQCTVFVVLNRRGASADGRVFSGIRADESEFAFCATETGATFGALTATGIIGAQSVADMTPAVYSLVINETAVVSRLNGLSAQLTEYSNTSPFKKFSIGATRSDYTVGSYSGDIAEIVVYSRVLTDAERQQVDGYLLNRWGIVQTAHPLLNGVVAFWPLNENDGTLLDSSGNGKNLLETGTVSANTGVVANGAEFSGGVNYLTQETLTLSSSFTISGWFKSPTTTGMTGQFMQNWNSNASSGQFVLGWGDEDGQSNELWAYVRTAGGYVRVAYPELAANEWRHFVLSLDAAAGTLSLYVDNVLADVADVTSALVTTTNELQFGIGEQGASQNSTACSLDSVGIWNRALLENEIAMLWNGGFGKEEFSADTHGDNVSLLLHMNKLPNAGANTGLNITAPIAYWKFNDTSGDFLDSVLDQPLTESGGSVDRTAGVAHIVDGDNTYLRFPSGLCDIDDGQKTFSLWFKLPQATTGYMWMWMRGGAFDYDGCLPMYFENTGYLNCAFTTQQNTWTNYGSYTTTSPTPNVWHHAVAVFNGSTCTLYYDGEQVNQISYSGAIRPCGASTLGRYDAYVPSSTIGGTSADFYIAEAGVWDTALTAEEVTTLFNAGYDTGYIPSRVEPGVDATLLLHFDGADGSTTFTDSSQNGLTVTANGNASISTAQSMFGGASGYFDGNTGTGMLFQPASNEEYSSLLLDADFTVEFWVNFDSFNDTQVMTMSRWQGGGTNGWAIWHHSGWPNKITFWADSFSHEVPFLESSSTVSAGVWYHVAVTRSGDKFTLWIDGVNEAEATQNVQITKSLISIGYYVDGNFFAYAYPLRGYIDEFRVVKGAAVYTANFTPPTQPFSNPEPITYFYDYSNYHHAVTANGDAQISTAQVKYGNAAGKFDGTGDYLTFDQKAFEFDADFTIEWFMSIDAQTLQAENGAQLGVFGNGRQAGVPEGMSGYIQVPISGYAGNKFEVDAFVGGSWRFPLLQAAVPFANSTWQHYAIVRAGTTYTLYIDGVEADAITLAGPLQWPNSAPASIGSTAGNTGEFVSSGVSSYIDDFRITKGIARYTTNFTPPTKEFPEPLIPPPGSAVDPYAEYVTLLLHMDGPNESIAFTDNSYLQNTITVNGNAQISTTQSKFGGSSAKFDGNGDYLTIPKNAAFEFGTGDFTVESWIYPTQLSGLNDYGNAGWTIVCLGLGANGGGPFTGWALRYAESNDSLYWYRYDGANEYGAIGATNGSMTTNTWHHVAVSRAAGTLRIYLDGVELLSEANSIDYSAINDDDLCIGRMEIGSPPFTLYFPGYIDDLRITKGVARYVGNFTPPTAAFLDPFSATGFNPTNVLGNELWLDADSPLFTFNNSVQSWGDLSGSNHPAVQVDYSPPPVLATGVTPTGLRAVQFNGEPNVLEVLTTFNLKNSTNFVVVRQTSQSNGAGYPRILSFSPQTGTDDAQNDGTCLVINQDLTDAVELYSDGLRCGDAASLPLGWTLLAYTVDSNGNIALRVNGAEVDTGSNSAMAATSGGNMVLGWGGSFYTFESLQGEIAAVIHYDHKLGPAALAAVEKYLYDKYLAVPATGTTSLLLHFDGTDGSTTFTDSSSNNLTMTVTGNPAISTSQSKFGGSGAFDGASFLSTPATPALDIGTGDFTIEAWVFLNVLPTTDDLVTWWPWMVVYERGSPSASDGWQFQIGQTKLMFSNGSGYEVCSGDHGMAPNQWYHVCVTRSGNTFRVFVDGVQVGTRDDSLALYGGTTYYIGCETGEGAYLDGYIDDLRVVKGAAAYTANFTPPTAPFNP